MEQQEQLLTRKELAEVLKISLPTLHKLVNSKKINAYKLGGNVRFKRSEINNLFKNNENGNNNQF